ncbi:hypothetical protein [Sphingomonas sp.]|jgi:CheY-like chemotaxis protein|uniref:hypothetical protein n=1 Tax=Sphingomonas sp. TaxID=28214 RepID=UPI002DE7118F|nr:hypothetical protein [Sphingomonas sp.]
MTEAPAILIVEDEPLISMMLEDFLDALGYRLAGCVDRVDDALDHVARGGFSAALLDVNLRDGETSWPVADALSDRGQPSCWQRAAAMTRCPNGMRMCPCSASLTRSTACATPSPRS